MARLGLQLNFVLLALVTVSMQLFNRVYRTSRQVIDEEFHLRQGLHFCRGNFTIWDPKITTFPGLYLVSTLIFAPLRSCSVYNLRLVSVIGGIVNTILIYKIREHVNRDSKIVMFHWVLALESLTISLLPPMFFFTFLYYTDILSITFVLAMTFFALKNHHFSASFFGLCSVLMRQTNIVWVAVIFGHVVLSHIASHRRKKVPDVLTYDDLFQTIRGLLTDIFKRPGNFLSDFKFVVTNFWGYLVVLAGFVAFVINNGSIVVGDKSAHEANLHLPQIFYFGLFAAFFGPQNLLMNLGAVLRLLIRNKLKTIIVSVIILLIVHFNTVVHPYLLADNRHYTFYVWNRFYGRHPLAKYAATPVYVVALALLQQNLHKINASLSALFVFALFATIGMQSLIEVRYFLLPFLFLRLFSRDARDRRYPVYLGLELLFYVLLNAASFYLFFTKEIHWKDFEDVQRIIW